MKISTKRLLSDNKTQISLETLMENVDNYLNSEVKKPYNLTSVNYVEVEGKFCAIMTIETV